MKNLIFLILLFLIGCAPRAFVRKNITKIHGDSNFPQVAEIQIFVDGEWWTVERFVITEGINW